MGDGEIMIKGLLIGVSLAGLAVTGSMVVVNAHQVSGDVSSQIAALTELQTISSSVSELKAPTIKDPQWLEAQLAAEKAAAASAASSWCANCHVLCNKLGNNIGQSSGISPTSKCDT